MPPNDHSRRKQNAPSAGRPYGLARPLYTAVVGIGSGVLIAALLAAWSIWRTSANTPRHRALLHIPDTWQLITITRPPALSQARGALTARLQELLADPLDSPFPKESDNLDAAFDVQFPGDVHVRFWTFHQPPAPVNIVGTAQRGADIRGVATWKHAIGWLAMPDPCVVVASADAGWLETVVLEGMVRMRPVASAPEADFAVEVNLAGENTAFSQIRRQITTLAGTEMGDMPGFRRLSLAFRFTDPSTVDLVLVGDSRERAAQYAHQHEAAKGSRQQQLDRLVTDGIVRRGTSEYDMFKAAIDAPARVDGDRITVSINLPAESLVALADFALQGSHPMSPAPESGDNANEPRAAAPIARTKHPPTKMQSLDECLLALKGTDRIRQMEAARYLLQHPPEAARRSEAMNRVIDVLKQSDRHADEYLTRALRALATQEDVPALLEALASDSLALRRASLLTLAHFPSMDSAAAVAECLASDRSQRKTARDTLQQMGALAEPAARDLLSRQDKAVRIEACRILAVIGTHDSVAALTDALDDRLVARHAREALAAIEQRTGRE